MLPTIPPMSASTTSCSMAPRMFARFPSKRAASAGEMVRHRPAAHGPERRWSRSPIRRAQAAVSAARARRHRRADAEAQGEPLSRRPAQGPLVQVEARRADAGLRADVCPARLGKRSSYYSDYTFGVWKTDGGAVPVGKAYSGFTDEELLRLDRWIRNNTIERFGPVRAVKPETGPGGRLRCRPALDPAQIRRRHALPPHPPHPLGTAGPTCAAAASPLRGPAAEAVQALRGPAVDGFSPPS